jgi:hypothetical protein
VCYIFLELVVKMSRTLEKAFESKFITVGKRECLSQEFRVLRGPITYP